MISVRPDCRFVPTSFRNIEGVIPSVVSPPRRMNAVEGPLSSHTFCQRQRSFDSGVAKFGAAYAQDDNSSSFLATGHWPSPLIPGPFFLHLLRHFLHIAEDAQQISTKNLIKIGGRIAALRQGLA